MKENALFLKNPAGGYPTIVRGEGIHLYDEEGRRYIDGAAGASNVTLGHGRGDIARVLGEQAETLAYAFSVHFENKPAQDFAERLTALAPGDLDKAYFVSGGSEAIESAMKIARQYHLLRGNDGKQLLISRWGGYHGGTLGAMSLSGVPGPRRPSPRGWPTSPTSPPAIPTAAASRAATAPATSAAPTTSMRRSGATAPKTWPPSSAACRRRATSPGCARSATATTCSSSPTRSSPASAAAAASSPWSTGTCGPT